MNAKPAVVLAKAFRDMTEEALVGAARKQDEGAVRELIRRLNPRLFRVARGIVDSDAAAEDVVQETYLAAFTRLPDFRGDAQFSTWITRIAINAARMQCRRAHATEEYDTVTETDASGAEILAFPGSRPVGAEAARGRSEVREMLEAVISDLPTELRLVFLLREAEGLSILTIARDLGLNPITVKTRLFRARMRLRAGLLRRLNGGFDAVFPFDGARCANMAERVVARLRAAGQL